MTGWSCVLIKAAMIIHKFSAILDVSLGSVQDMLNASDSAISTVALFSAVKFTASWCVN